MRRGADSKEEKEKEKEEEKSFFLNLHLLPLLKWKKVEVKEEKKFRLIVHIIVKHTCNKVIVCAITTSTSHNATLLMSNLTCDKN